MISIARQPDHSSPPRFIVFLASSYIRWIDCSTLRFDFFEKEGEEYCNFFYSGEEYNKYVDIVENYDINKWWNGMKFVKRTTRFWSKDYITTTTPIYLQFRKRVERWERSARLLCFLALLWRSLIRLYIREVGLDREGNMVKIFNRPIDRPFAG